MNSNQLFEQIREKATYLCVGLDTDHNKIPKFLLETEYPVFEFNKKIIEATADLAVAYKINVAFYEALGAAGWINMELTVSFLRDQYPDLFLIADAKRGDIGNTAKMYANAFFHNLDFDAITINPYMGKDSVSPFLDYQDKWIILLALTSNQGADDFQLIKTGNSNEYLFEHIIQKSKEWGNTDNIMYVAGATRSEQITKIREIIPEHFLLIPGIGSQGGNLQDVSENGMNEKCGILVNVSRHIIYADITNKFGQKAREKAIELQNQMKKQLRMKKIL